MLTIAKNLYDYRELMATLAWKDVTLRYKRAYLSKMVPDPPVIDPPVIGNNSHHHGKHVNRAAKLMKSLPDTGNELGKKWGPCPFRKVGTGTVPSQVA